MFTRANWSHLVWFLSLSKTQLDLPWYLSAKILNSDLKEQVFTFLRKIRYDSIYYSNNLSEPRLFLAFKLFSELCLGFWNYSNHSLNMHDFPKSSWQDFMQPYLCIFRQVGFSINSAHFLGPIFRISFYWKSFHYP
jgi:hypothetical protein